MAGFHGQVTHKLIEVRASRAMEGGWPIPKYIEFCAWALAHDFTVHLDESNTTVSKYVYISENTGGRCKFKIRFSNHKPSRYQELAEDCDFYVGFTHTGIRTTEDARAAVLEWRNSGKSRTEEERRPGAGRSGQPGHGRSRPNHHRRR